MGVRKLQCKTDCRLHSLIESTHKDLYIIKTSLKFKTYYIEKKMHSTFVKKCKLNKHNLITKEY